MNLTPEQQKKLSLLRNQVGNKDLPDQRSTSDQLLDLLTIANTLGMYDAADVLRSLIQAKKKVV